MVSNRRPAIAHGPLVFGILGTVVLLLIGSGCAGHVTRLRMEAGPVRSSPSGLTGSFRVMPSRDGIASGGTGGACLVIRQESSPDSGTCQLDRDCAAGPADPPDSHAYCLDRDHRTGTGRCWLRPGSQSAYCRLFKDKAIPTRTAISFPVDRDGRPVAAPARPGFWRVHACLDGLTPGACGNEGHHDRLTSDGQLTQLSAGTTTGP